MSNRVQLDFMTDSQDVGSASWVEIYSLASPSVDLISFVIKLNTNKMFLRITLDPGGAQETVVVDVNLDELESNFKVSNLDNSLITTPKNKVWAYQPKQPQWTNSGFKIEVKSESGNKILESGYVEWSEK